MSRIVLSGAGADAEAKGAPGGRHDRRVEGIDDMGLPAARCDAGALPRAAGPSTLGLFVCCPLGERGRGAGAGEPDWRRRNWHAVIVCSPGRKILVLHRMLTRWSNGSMAAGTGAVLRLNTTRSRARAFSSTGPKRAGSDDHYSWPCWVVVCYLPARCECWSARCREICCRSHRHLPRAVGRSGTLWRAWDRCSTPWRSLGRGAGPRSL